MEQVPWFCSIRDRMTYLNVGRGLNLALGACLRVPKEFSGRRILPTAMYVWSGVCLSVCLSFCLSVFLFACLSFCMSFFLNVFLFVCLSFCMSFCLSSCLSVCLLFCLSVFLFVCLYVYVSVCICLSVCLSSLSVRLPLCLSFCLPVLLSACLSVCLPVCLFACLYFYLSVLSSCVVCLPVSAYIDVAFLLVFRECVGINCGWAGQCNGVLADGVRRLSWVGQIGVYSSAIHSYIVMNSLGQQAVRGRVRAERS